jgi:hypothetical protein
VTRNRLQIGTYEFTSDCNSVTFCNPNTNKCERKKCRRDEYPFGYKPGASLPPRCPDSQFCPDEQDGCLDKLVVDSDCQLNRDGETTPPLSASKGFLWSCSTQTSANLLRTLTASRIHRPMVSTSTEPSV